MEKLSRGQSMVSFENLVALANYQERIKGARKVLWRDKGQPVADLPTLRDCLEHAAMGGIRSATLAFNIRASFNVFLALLRMRKVPRAQWLALLRHAIFGSDSFRFGAMLGTFAALYKFLINALPILIPAIHPTAHNLPSPFGEEAEDSDSSSDSGLTTPVLPHRRSPRLSLSAHAQMALVRKRTRRWHSALAGAISGGLAILWEKRSRRAVIAQQVFVRGLQGTYNAQSERWGISIPYGAVIVFSLSCGQIMYAFFLRPDTLPRSYVGWILEASKTPAEVFRFNIKAVQEHAVDIPALDRLIERPEVTPANLSALLSLRERALAGAADLPRYIPCYGLHFDMTSCWGAALDKFTKVARWMLPIYSALHFVPTLLFRWHMLRADPARVLGRTGVGSLRSSAFLGAFVVLMPSGLLHQAWALRAHHGRARVLPPPQAPSPEPSSTSSFSAARGGCAVSRQGLALLIEDERRRAELAMYVLPKGLESLWVAARGQGLVLRTGNWGEGRSSRGSEWAWSMTIYQNDPQHLSGLVRRILYQFIGPN
ncbi:hypothetical protein FB451DRAFT_1230689 [Mycena latifolia]|nr:hypothetical protein FB451DRAFT_1230689 [Mycena latifolia]